MELTDLNSIFELFCAFNFAYATHDGFSETINSKIVDSFENILNNIEQGLKQKLKLNETTVSNITIINTLEINTECLFSELHKTKINIEDDIKSYVNYVNNYKNTYYITRFFKFISLYSALFCVVFLLFNSTTSFEFKKNNSDLINLNLLHFGCNEALFVFSLLSFIFILFLMNMDINFIKKLTLKKFSYVKTILVFIVVSLISFIVFLICLKYNYYCNLNNLKILTIILSLIIPISHFIIYLSRILYLSLNGEKNLWNDFHIISDKISEYEKKVQDLVSVHESIKMSIKKNSPN